MTFDDILAQVLDLLQREGRVSYRALKRRFDLDDNDLEDLKDEIIAAKQLASDEDGKVLVWTGRPSLLHPPSSPAQMHTPPAARPIPEAERRQLTVLFCDLVDSTRLAQQLDPEDLRQVVLAYQATCVKVLQRFDGYIAQYLGDGLLVYFGYPQAHEDDAQRAVRTGLGILDAMGALNTRLAHGQGLRLAVRIGIHTGPVVVGTMGSGGRHEQLALGETPNLAARLQSLAAPDTVVISDTTYRLVQGYFTYDDLGMHGLKGIETHLRVYRVVGASAAQSRLEVAAATGLTPLVGRDHELGLLRQRWAQSQDGLGQVVLLSGEAGIGKSRLVHVLTEQVADEGKPRLTLRCSPYHTNSAFYPVIEHLQRFLQWQRHETPAARLAALEEAIRPAGLSPVEVVPLLVALLSLPVPERYPPLTLSPQRQKHKTLEALVAWLLADAARQPVLAVWEDLHWADPSTMELLALLLDQVPTARLLLVLTCRPEFRSPWAPRSYVTSLTLTHLTRQQIEEMVLRLTGGKPVPAEVLVQIVAKTDGIPLFVEELFKTVLEAGLMQESAGRYELTGPLPPLAIPATLQDALMARLDRLAVVKDVAQLGAVLGREFSYELLRAVTPLDETTLQQALAQLVEAELLYQRGLPPQATYVFKHALIQDAAYQSLLKSTRQQFHQRIAQALVAQFADLVETQPELVAHRYTAAGLHEPAVVYWQRAGQRAVERSANVEAISHLTKGLEVIQTLPESHQCSQRELDMQITLALALHALKGQAAPDVERAYARARALCEQVEDAPQLFRVLMGLYRFYGGRMQRQKAREIVEQLYSLAQRTQNPDMLLQAHTARGTILLLLGELVTARGHLEQAIARYDLPQHHAHAFRYSLDPGVLSLSRVSWTLWLLGYPDQALRRSQETLALTRERAHPHSLAMALCFATMFHQFRREAQAAHELAEATVALATEQGLTQFVAAGTFLQGWALTAQGQGEDGLAQLRQGLAAYRATGTVLDLPWFLGVRAEAYGHTGQAEAGLATLAEALAAVDKTDFYEAELYRLKGEVLVRQTVPDASQAETCFHQALDIARRQQAKAWELRATTSLARLWQQQGKRDAAHELLANVYGWFTEGFDTADLQDARALLAALSGTS